MAVGRPQVSIRLGTTGRSDVESDFAAIGDSGDAQAKRYQASWERASAEAERALEKQAKAAARLAAAAPTSSGATNMVNPITGGSYAQSDGRAEASAKAIAASYDQADAAARRLLASVDPLYAAQMRYDAALQEAIGLQKIGALTTDQLAVVQTGLKKELDDTTALYGKHGAAVGNSRIAQMELMHVVRGSVDQFAAGAAPMQIFTMHLGMLGQAAALSGESMGKFGAFMSTGWGLALTVAVVALAPLISKLTETGDTVDSLVEKLKKQSAQQALNDQANHAYASTLDGVTDALKKNKEALDGIIAGEKSAAEKSLAAAITAKARLELINQLTLATINQAKAQIELNNAEAIGPETKSGRPDPHLVAADQARASLAALEATLPKINTDLAEAQRQIDTATAAVYAQAAGEDDVQRIKNIAQRAVDAATAKAAKAAETARAAGDEAKAQRLITTELQRQVVAINAKRDADVKAYEAAHKPAGANAGGTAIFNDQIASFFDIAARYRGQSETKDRSSLKSFLGDVDPEKTAWCAAFVNAVLAAGGVHGTGSLAAKSFLNFGKDDTHSPQRGDIAVVKSGAGDHVGFVDSVDKAGNVRMLAGNTGNKVAEATYSKNQVLAIRRPPTPSESAAADDKAQQEADRAAVKALEQQQRFDGEKAKLNGQYLEALGKVVAGADAQATMQLVRAQAEHDADAQQIATNLAEGKYGEATSKLAQARAQQLTAANDQVLHERQAAISLEAYVKSLDDRQRAFDQLHGFQIDDLKFADGNARTAREHRDLQLQMLDILYEQKRYDLLTLKAKQELAGEFKKAAETQASIDRLPTDKAHDQARTRQETMSPGEQYLDSLPKNMGEVRDAIERDGVDALDKFNEGLVTVLMNSKTLGEAWHNLKGVFHDVAASILADMIKLAEKEAILAIFKTVMRAVGGGFGGGGGGDWSFGASGGYDAANADLAGGLATGTEYAPGGLTWVGENGKELVQLPQGSKVYNASTSRRMAAANDGGPKIGSITMNNDFRGADAQAVDAIQARLDQMQRGMAAQIVGTMQDARQRFMWR
jgi:uncharacterized protein (TIGR02594 family)